MLVRSRKQTPVFIVIPFHTTSGSSRVQSRTILAPSWNWHSALGFSLGLSRTTLAPPWSWHSALGFGFVVESDNASPILELAFGTRSSISRAVTRSGVQLGDLVHGNGGVSKEYWVVGDVGSAEIEEPGNLIQLGDDHRFGLFLRHFVAKPLDFFPSEIPLETNVGLDTRCAIR
ncbi:hypothetical protein B0H17DRAFT_1177253 [Mycena rosella]|uniref:Uncharacterized protein n=1 Tax=Mycena rosella TaxID=1033263 RepID=A0AAD7DS79_MYCRO|nr:hypothetical protein B0H17DRAFT_1177253 [Mycena rosella]